MEPALDPEAVADETRRADALLRQSRLSRAEAEAVVSFTRTRVLELFPGKEDVWGLVLAPRFARILEEFCAPPPARVLPFRRR
jgi:hypothetical protein